MDCPENKQTMSSLIPICLCSTAHSLGREEKSIDKSKNEGYENPPIRLYRYCLRKILGPSVKWPFLDLPWAEQEFTFRAD